MEDSILPNVADVPKCAHCTSNAVYSATLKRYIRECSAHQGLRLDHDRERRKRKLAEQRCMACNNLRDENSIYCTTHRHSHSQRMKLRRQVNRAHGVCVECGAEVNSDIGDGARCPAHVEQQREYTNRIDSLPPQFRRHYARYCSICGVFQVHNSALICTVCNESRTHCVEYEWHTIIEKLATKNTLWPPSSSTFSHKKAFGGVRCDNEKLVFADMVFLLNDRLVVLECDEFCHEKIDVNCEMARMDAMQFGIQREKVLPIIIVRMNPHNLLRRCIWTDFSEKVEKFWSFVRDHCLLRDYSLLPPIERVEIHFFYYNDNDQHVMATAGNERFIVTSH